MLLLHELRAIFEHAGLCLWLAMADFVKAFPRTDRGDLLLNIGRQAEAIENYGKALEIEPDDSGVLNNLAWLLATSPNAKLRDGERKAPHLVQDRSM